MSIIETGYRKNNTTSIEERLTALENKYEKAINSSESVRIAKIIVGSILTVVALTCVSGYACNAQDNKAAVESAKFGINLRSKQHCPPSK